ncbi:ABC transporter ATP-binding protein/permease [Oscillospiraceae bacterium OttesenSCG-928-G22]|nr:ABC transporter ATP-binding protein/permease [Oscillospiraceae bacterium OttesenSCG-928-G22]
MLTVLKRLKPYRAQIAIVVLLLFVMVICDLYLPNLMSEIVNTGIPSGDTGYVLFIGLRMLAVALIGTACSVTASYFSSRVSMGFGRALRSETFSHVTSFSLTEVDTIGTSSLITRTTNDVIQLQNMMMMALRMMVSVPLNMIGGIVMAVSKDIILACVVLGVVPILALVIVLSVRKVMPIFKTTQVKLDRLNQVFREKLSGIRVIRAFRRENHEKERFEDANMDLSKNTLGAFRIMVRMMPLAMFFMNLAAVAIIWVGATRIDAGFLAVGDLMAFLQYVTIILFSIMMGSMMIVMLPRASVSADRIAEVLALENSVHDPETETRPDESSRGHLRFDHVTFRYPGAEEPVLRDISFEANPGETVAIIGGTGSGKSTLAKLIPRFFDVAEGSIALNGVDARNMSQKTLRARIGFVPQRAMLFSGTIRENLSYGNPGATDEELRKAAEIAQALDFISALPEGMDAPVSQDSTNLSGGQKQRLSIARAIAMSPEVFVFDDSFSALDFKTDTALRAALREVTADKTVILIAQRVSTIMTADRILVLDDGEAKGLGTHAELLETCPTYREIVESQLHKEDIA